MLIQRRLGSTNSLGKTNPKATMKVPRASTQGAIVWNFPLNSHQEPSATKTPPTIKPKFRSSWYDFILIQPTVPSKAGDVGCTYRESPAFPGISSGKASIPVKRNAKTATPYEIEPYRKSQMRQMISLGGGADFLPGESYHALSTGTQQPVWGTYTCERTKYGGLRRIPSASISWQRDSKGFGAERLCWLLSCERQSYSLACC